MVLCLIVSFPDLCTVSYFKQTKSYTDEHFDEKGSNEIMAHKEHDGVLKAQIRSRHTSSKTYNLWVKYTQGLNLISGWYCGCRSGARTLGCCAHAATVLWYLGYYRNKTENSEAKPSKLHIDYVKMLLLTHELCLAILKKINDIQRKNMNGPYGL